MLLDEYLKINTVGCGKLEDFPSSDFAYQRSMTFDELLKKYPNEEGYCFDVYPLRKENIKTFLSAKNILQRIVRGENVTLKNP